MSKALEALDGCVARIVEAIENNDGKLLKIYYNRADWKVTWLV